MGGQRSSSPKSWENNAIAVVGMACRFPGDATNIEEFWQMLKDGRDAWSEIPENRFNTKGWYHPDPSRPGSFHIRGAHFLKEDIDAFDAPFFSISTAEAVSMDPQQRMLLEVVYEALDSAGIPVSSLSNTATSVFCGSFVRDYEQPCMRDPDTTPPYSATGNGIAILANRVSHAFDFAGTSQTIDTGCSASMIAVHQACKSLLDGESCIGIAAGAGLIFSPNTLVPMAGLNILSPDGRCFTFDKRANGYGRGEGVGVVVLKRLQDAISSNDTIRAVIRATATNQDGHTQGITLPSTKRQVQNMKCVYESAGLDVSRTAYVECHGTGTQAGDLKEAEAVFEVFRRHRANDKPLIIGSVKTNIGHLEGSAGVAGLIKGILVAERGYIPKHVNFTCPNPQINFNNMRLKIASDLTQWPIQGLRRISVNSFGFGGTNAHAVLDDAAHFLDEHNITDGKHFSFLYPDDRLSKPIVKFPKQPRNRLFVFSGHDEAGLRRVLDSQAHYIRAHSKRQDFEKNYSYSLLSRRSALHWRTYIIAASAAELLQKLEAHSIVQPYKNKIPTSNKRSLSFVFSGQGAQWFAMGRELFQYNVFRESVSAASRFMSMHLGSPFHIWDELHRSLTSTHIDEPQIAQPATTVIQVALVDLLASSGICPSAVVGHSSGEIAAAYAFGALSREDAWMVAYHRGQCISRLSTLAPSLRGAMIAVNLSGEQARCILVEAGCHSVTVGCVNGPASVTLSGDSTEISQIQEILRKSDIRVTPINVQTAYHSSHMHMLEEIYLNSLKNMSSQSSTPQRRKCKINTSCKFFSSVFGREASAEELCPEYWVKNLVRPVQFYQAVTAMLEQVKPAVQLDVSPHQLWKSTLQKIYCEPSTGKRGVSDSAPAYVSMLCRGQDASVTAFKALGELWMRGFPLIFDWDSDGTSPLHLVDIPSYPWDHSRRYWHESHLSKANRFRSHGREDIIGAPLESSTAHNPSWRGFFRVQENPWLEDHVIQKSIIYPAGGMIAMVVEAAKQLTDPHRAIHSFQVRNFSIERPMLIPKSSQGLEHMLSAHLTDSYETTSKEMLSSLQPLAHTYARQKRSTTPVYDFSILSKPEEGAWVVHAKGLFSIIYTDTTSTTPGCVTKPQRQEYYNAVDSCEIELCPRQFYECLDVVGMTYGPQFRNLTEIRVDHTAAYTTIRIPNTRAQMPYQFEFGHIIHPTTLDTMLQTVLALGDETSQAMLPCSIEKITVYAKIPKGAGSLFRGLTTTKRVSQNTIRADIYMFDDQLEHSAVTMENLVLKSTCNSTEVSGTAAFLPSNRSLCSEIVWKQDINLFSSLRMAYPDIIQAIFDLASHKKPDLSIIFHVDSHIATDNQISTLSHGVTSSSSPSFSALVNLIFDALTLGYETPRFSEFIFAGSKLIWQQLCASKKSRPGIDRISFSEEFPNRDKEFDIFLCSAPIFNNRISQSCARVAPGGWIIIVPDQSDFFSLEHRETLAYALQSNGFRKNNTIWSSNSFFIAQKMADSVLPAPIEKITLILPDDMTCFVKNIRDALLSIINNQLSAEAFEVSFSMIHTVSPEQLSSTPCVCLAEVASPVVFTAGKDAYEMIHHLLSLSRNMLWLTCGAQMDVKEPLRSPFIGLARTIRSEDAKKTIISLDLDIQSAIGDNSSLPKMLHESIGFLLSRICKSSLSGPLSDDVEYAFSRGRLLIPRLMPLTAMNRLIERGSAAPEMISQTPVMKDCKALKLDATSIGNVNGPLFIEDWEAIGRPLHPDEVRIEVFGTYLLPEDVAVANSKVQNAKIGTDIFGHVIEVGSDVDNFLPKDYVVVRMRDTIRTHVIAHQTRVYHIHQQAGWANSCPTAFATALHALQRHQPYITSESVLIYGAASAYGQAVIRIALAQGSLVLVACSSMAERNFMNERFMLPLENILDTQNTDDEFEAQLMSMTFNHGVDVVFDPTSQHVEQAFRCVAECGRIVRLASTYYNAPSVRLTDKNASLETINLDLLEARCPGEMQRLLNDVSRMLEIIPGLDETCGLLEYKLSHIDDALKAAMANPFAGPYVITTGVGMEYPVYVNTPVRLTQDTQLSSSSTYLLIGGFGGLGRAMAMHLAKKGARHVAFFSRSGCTSAPAKKLLAELQAKEVDARAFAVNISQASSLATAIEELHACMPRIRGTIQCATVMNDMVFSSMDYESWKKSFEPKTTGSYNLHRLLPADMDFFIFLSSSSGVIGNRGQANYAAGNCFQDALARHRSARGMHSVSLDFGLVLGAGMVAEDEGLLDTMRANGFFGMRLQDVLFLLDRAMARPGTEGLSMPAQVVTAVGTGGLTIQNRPLDPFWTSMSLFRYLNQVDAPSLGLRDNQTGGCGQNGSGKPGHGKSNNNLRAAIRGAATTEDAVGIVSTALVATLARRKSMVSGDFDLDQPLGSYGIDSLDSMFLIGWISREMGVTVQTLDGLTIAELSETVVRRNIEALEKESGDERDGC